MDQAVESRAATGVDPAVRAIIEARVSGADVDLDSLPLDQAMAIARPSPPAKPIPDNAEDVMVRACDGNEIRVRLYYPERRDGPLPAVMHLHGGGFVTGTIEMDDARCILYAREAGCIVASVGYRLAPEHPYPTAVEDAFAAWRWLTTDAADKGVDGSRCVVSGSSAGGHVAIGLCLVVRKRGVVRPLLQLLAYPVVDPGLATSSAENAENYLVLTRSRMAWFWKQYAGKARPHGELWQPLAADAKGLPPAHIVTAEYDLLRDEGEAWGAHLHAAGIAVTVERFPGMVHGFLTVAANHPESQRALTSTAAALRTCFHG